MTATNDIILGGWALDFVRALADMPKWRRWLFRMVVGKYAYREFVGLLEEINKDHFLLIGYGLENASYHIDTCNMDFLKHIKK